MRKFESIAGHNTGIGGFGHGQETLLHVAIKILAKNFGKELFWMVNSSYYVT